MYLEIHIKLVSLQTSSVLSFEAQSKAKTSETVFPLKGIEVMEINIIMSLYFKSPPSQQLYRKKVVRLPKVLYKEMSPQTTELEVEIISNPPELTWESGTT